MESINFSADFQEFKENSERAGEFEGLLVNYNHSNLAHGFYKFVKGSMKMNEGKTLFILYNHESRNIPVGTMTGVDTDDGFKIVAKFDLSKDEGGYINKDAAKLYNLMKAGAKFELSAGGWLVEYAEKKENDKRFYEITKFDAYEGSITPRGAVKGSKVTKVFKDGGDENMTREEMQELLKEFGANMMKAQTDEEIKALPSEFKKLQAKFDEIKANFTKEVTDGFEAKFNEINEVIKGLKKDFKATSEEVSDAEQFAAMLGIVNEQGVKVTETFSADREISFAAVSAPGTTTNLDKAIKPTYVTKILERLQAINPVLADINFINIADNSLYIPREMAGLPETGWVGETDARNDTKVTGIDNVTINLFQLYALPTVSNRLLATNFVGYANFLMRRVEYALGLALANAALNGTGTNQPKGILKEDLTSKEIDTTDDAAFVDSLIDVYYSVREEISRGAKWYMTRGTWAAIAKLKNAQKDFYITDLNTGNSRTLMTRPVVIIEDENAGLKDIGTATATTDPVILFADLGMAMQGIQNNKLDIRIEDKITQKGVTKYYMEKLLGVGTQLPEYAVKVVKKS